ncbi:hypothetical protein GA707_05845 [Nostocoides sp. F2B08]|uniref:hypothetical protein n=1 Tax=Nostocoides sp. F2B08 TaxID=2653936 RepID=UPI001263C3D7|nr:hypothetical protein [Tetrasphaera sp. F2B08]KAB7745448.1 hypothetical protein GA707_05845 [Tetrasphaera sp. F2B08]
MSATSTHKPTPTSSRARTLTLAAYLVNLAYLVWFWVMFAGAYWVASWFDIDPAEESVFDQGLLGWVAGIGSLLVMVLPSLVGALLALRAKRAGAGTAATVALVLNLALPVGWIALQVLLAP